ncbi:hypothetical protein OB955_24175 [Halobacteria archaeon AArc-m2/3/4]|uniref:DUF7344 domain-containing protein n=1 Tax=Natronoglomus mannanivorans TaxID=2979990 RepID=A0AAP2YZY8_9EURY|nr:hypothetical protein [Halobacteria archaeon AArc-xg1-1]MCU4975784.1 hypothetical protein [Halobacteria archaeon AArc-m2/3/4]
MDADSPSLELELDTVFSILDTCRRRTTLAVLDDHQTVALADLADEVAVREHDTRITNLSPEAVTEIYLDLYHNHVPKLADAGLATYDQERDLIASIDRLDELEPFLSMARTDECLEEPIPTADYRELGDD